MNTKHKLIIGFSIIILLFIIVGYINIMNIYALHNNINLLDEKTIPVINSLKDIKINSLEILSFTMEVTFMELNNYANLSEEKEEIGEGKTSFYAAFQRYNALVETYFSNETEFRDEIKERGDALINVSDEIVILKEQGITDKESVELKDKLEEAEENLLESIDEALKYEDAETKTKNDAVETTVKDSLINTLSIILFTILISLLVGVIVSRSISKPLKKLVYVTNEIGKGNFDVKTEITSKDEFEELSINFDKMVEDLKKSTISINDLDKQVKQRTENLESKNDEIEQFNKILVGRELKMIELKKRISELEGK